MRFNEYQEVLVEIFEPTEHEHTDAKKRFRPVEGQGLDTDMRVEYCRKVRDKYPVGTKLKIKAKVTDREDGLLFFTPTIIGLLLMLSCQNNSFI